MEINSAYLAAALKDLTEASSKETYLIDQLKEFGFTVEKFENGTIFAYLLGDMPGKEGSLFAAGYDPDHLPGAAEILAAMHKITSPTSYRSVIHHPDIEVVFSPSLDAEAVPDFKKIFSQNAYLLTQNAPAGQIVSDGEAIVSDRFRTVSEGLGNRFLDREEEAGAYQKEFSSHAIRTAAVSFGAEDGDYAHAAEIVLFLAVAYRE